MAEGTHLHVGLLKAWELWIQGRDLKGDGDAMWGLGMIWWSRIGVVAGFLGGLVIVLDIVGEERLRAYGITRWRKKVAHAAPSVHRILIDVAILVASVWGAVILAGRVPDHAQPAPPQQASSDSDPFLLPFNEGPSDPSGILIMLVGVLAALSIYMVLELAVIALKSERLVVYARTFALAMLVVSAHFTLLTS